MALKQPLPALSGLTTTAKALYSVLLWQLTERPLIVITAGNQQAETLGDTRIFLLPSPSPLAANHWDIKPWHALARAVKKL